MPERIDACADLIVRIAADLQPGQTLFLNTLPEDTLTRPTSRASRPTRGASAAQTSRACTPTS